MHLLEVKPPRAPLFLAALFFSAGILAAHNCSRPSSWIIIPLAVIVTASVFFLLRRREHLAYALILLSLSFLGFLALRASSEARSAEIASASLARFTTGEEVAVSAHVLKSPLSYAPVSERSVVDLETETLTDAAGEAHIRSVIRLSIYQTRHDDDEEVVRNQLLYGERIRFVAKLREPRNFGNPGAWDYAGYLHQQGISALGSTRVDRIERLAGKHGTRYGFWRDRARRSVIAMIHRLWPEQQAGLIDAMLIGERAFVERSTSVDFQRSGTYHILVVSGMNVGILAFVVFWTLRRVRAGDVVASVVTILLSLGYAYLCDSGAPLLRSTAMISLYLIGRLFFRDRASLNVVGAAALLVLLIDPPALFDASFQLTFLSVAAIAGIGVPLLKRTIVPLQEALRHFESTSYDQHLRPRQAQFRIDLRLLLSRLERIFGRRIARTTLLSSIGIGLAVAEVVVISALMQIVLALPMATYFHRATMLALPANIVVLPLTEVMMPAAVAAVGIGYVSPMLAHPAAWIAGWALIGIVGTVTTVGRMHSSDLRVADPTLILTIATLLTIGLGFLLARKSLKFLFAGLLAIAASAFWIVVIPRTPEIRSAVLEVTAIDVGQADSTLVISPDGKKILIDAAGPLGFGAHSDFDFGENVVSPYLWHRGITQLDAVVITHAHSDHIGGMRSILTNFKPRELWLGPNTAPPVLQPIMDQASAHGEIKTYAAGDSFDWGGMHVRALSPSRDQHFSEKAENDDSLVLHFAYGKTSVLLAADAQRQVESKMITLQPESTLLKVAHNGSLTSTTPEFLAAVHPQYAFVSAGFRNQFHHPRPETLAKLASAHVHTYRTDLMGALTFYLDGTRVTVRTGPQN